MLVIFLYIIFIQGCITTTKSQKYEPQKVIIEVQAVDPTKVEIGDGDKIQRSMEVPNQEGSLSRMSFIIGKKGYIKLFGTLTVSDAVNMWQDLRVLKSMGIKDVLIYLNSGGGGAFAGLALSNEIIKGKKNGFDIEIQVSGLVASAAIPVLSSGSFRIATNDTIFMCHQPSIFVWPGIESHSDIEAKKDMMDLLKDRYLTLLAKNSKLSKEEWKDHTSKTTWFDASQALTWGLIDEIR